MHLTIRLQSLAVGRRYYIKPYCMRAVVIELDAHSMHYFNEVKDLKFKRCWHFFFLKKCAVESIWAFRIHVKRVAATLVSPSKPHVPLVTYLQLTVINFVHYAGPLANNSKRSCSRNIDNSEGTNCFCRS
jgi:hypothetical protein